MMRIAFSTISCPEYTAEQIAAAARAYAYDGIELYAMAGQRLTPDILRANLASLQRAFRPGGIPIVCLNSWAHLSDSDPLARAAQEAQIVRACELAGALQCPLVKTFGGDLPAGVPPATVYDAMAEAISRLCRHASRLGVRLVVETHDGFSRGAAVAELLQRVSDTTFGALWDIHHPYRMGETIAETAALLGDRVVHAHVKDATRRTHEWHFALLGEGELPVEEMIRQLARRRFDGYLSVDWEKMWHPELPGPEIALPQYAAALRRTIAKVLADSQ